MITADNLTSMVILLEFVPQFKLWNDHIRIWCDFGTGVNRKATSTNSIYERLGKALCLALPFFHVFSGCDSTSPTTQRTSCLVLYTKKLAGFSNC